MNSKKIVDLEILTLGIALLALAIAPATAGVVTRVNLQAPGLGHLGANGSAPRILDLPRGRGMIDLTRLNPVNLTVFPTVNPLPRPPRRGAARPPGL